MAARHALATFWFILVGLAVGSGFELVGSWERVQSMTDNASGAADAAPLGRVPAASVACDGKLYVFGGETDDNSGQAPNRFLNDLWTYTPDQGWAMTSSGSDGSGPPPRVLSSMVCAHGQLTIFGGVKRISPVDNVIVGDVWSFNLAQGAWRQLQQNSADQSGPGPTSSHTATLVDSQPDLMIVFGGSDLQGAATDKMWVYSLSTNTWTKLSPEGPLPRARSFHTAIAIPGTSALKMWGGVDDRSVWTYDLQANAWSVASSDLPYESGRSGAVLNGEFFSFGGLEINHGQTFYDNTVSMQVADGSWREVQVRSSAVPGGRCYAAFASIGTYIYMFGGYRREGTPGTVAAERLPDLWRLSLTPGTGVHASEASVRDSVVV